MLLAISLLGVGLVKTGLVPTKIAALGVEFDKTSQKALLFLVAVVAAYFLVAFLIYALADFLAWRRALRTYELDRMRQYIERERAKRSVPEDDEITSRAHEIWGDLAASRGHRVVWLLSGPVSVVRAVFEFALPVVVGSYAVALLWSAAGRI
jgi:hypothetical protein